MCVILCELYERNLNENLVHTFLYAHAWVNSRNCVISSYAHRRRQQRQRWRRRPFNCWICDLFCWRSYGWPSSSIRRQRICVLYTILYLRTTQSTICDMLVCCGFVVRFGVSVAFRIFRVIDVGILDLVCFAMIGGSIFIAFLCKYNMVWLTESAATTNADMFVWRFAKSNHRITSIMFHIFVFKLYGTVNIIMLTISSWSLDDEILRIHFWPAWQCRHVRRTKLIFIVPETPMAAMASKNFRTSLPPFPAVSISQNILNYRSCTIVQERTSTNGKVLHEMVYILTVHGLWHTIDINALSGIACSTRWNSTTHNTPHSFGKQAILVQYYSYSTTMYGIVYVPGDGLGMAYVFVWDKGRRINTPHNIVHRSFADCQLCVRMSVVRHPNRNASAEPADKPIVSVYSHHVRR